MLIAPIAGDGVEMASLGRSLAGPPRALPTHAPPLHTPPITQVDQHRFGAAAAADRAEDPDAGVVPAEAAGRSFELGPGCVAGSTDFFLARPHGSQAVCSSPVARVLALTRQGLTRLAAEVPQVLAVLQVIIMRANTLDLTVAAEVGHAGQVGD